MIGPVRIQNFKSVRDLGFEAKRVNLFIGEPNTGKSNIIEALAFLAEGVFNAFQEVVRFKTAADLFFDQKVADGIMVQAGDLMMSLRFNDAGVFEGTITKNGVQMSRFSMGCGGGLSGALGQRTSIRFYHFKPLTVFQNGQPGLLNPPFGDNLFAVLYSNGNLRQRIGSIIRSQEFRLQLKPTESELSITKDVNDELYSYPWTSVSETLRRIVFFVAVLETNQSATLLFDEPESNTFPFYTKYMAERIALDTSNQFFVTTHNPYLLSSVVEKTPAKDLAVFVTRMEQCETKVEQVPEKNLPELLELDSDAFFNLERLVKG